MPERAAQQQKSTDTVTDADLPNLGPDPTKLRASAIQLQPAIERYSPDNRTLLQNGTVQYRNVTAVMSPTHARLILADRYPMDHGFWNPAPLEVARDDSLAPPAPLGPLPPLAADGSQPPAVALDPNPYLISLSPNEEKLFGVFPSVIKVADEKMANAILACFEDTNDRDSYSQVAKNSGRTLIKAIVSDSSEYIVWLPRCRGC